MAGVALVSPTVYCLVVGAVTAASTTPLSRFKSNHYSLVCSSLCRQLASFDSSRLLSPGTLNSALENSGKPQFQPTLGFLAISLSRWAQIDHPIYPFNRLHFISGNSHSTVFPFSHSITPKTSRAIVSRRPCGPNKASPFPWLKPVSGDRGGDYVGVKGSGYRDRS